MVQKKNLVPTQLEELYQADRLIPVDYAYRPRHRRLDKSRSTIFKLINSGSDRYAAILRKLAPLAPFFERIPVHGDGVPNLSPHWVNGWFPGLDAISLYGLLALHDPRWYVEVGSGNSTMFARRAIQDHRLRTTIISIDPVPRADIDSICDKVIRLPFEDMPLDFFDFLSGDDMLFVDNSHRSFQNSDVTVFFTEILPNLPSRMIYGLHDIYLPLDYPQEWADRFYNEQYLLASYLVGGARADEILLPNAYLSLCAADHLDLLADTLNNPKLQGIEKSGGAFWMRRA